MPITINTPTVKIIPEHDVAEYVAIIIMLLSGQCTNLNNMHQLCAYSGALLRQEQQKLCIIERVSSGQVFILLVAQEALGSKAPLILQEVS